MHHSEFTQYRALPVRHKTGRLFADLVLLIFCVVLPASVAHAQGVGVGTNSPAASAILDVSSGDMGVLFPRMTTTARELIDPQSPEHFGMIVYDTTRRMMYIYDYDNDYGEARWKPLDAFWTEISPGRIVAGSNNGNVQIDGVGSEVFRIEASQRQVAGQFETFGSGYAYPTYGIISYVFNNSVYDKTGGRFDVWSTGDGEGRKTGVRSKVFGTYGENIGIHTIAEGASALNRAAWFEQGDVIIEDQVLVGADTIYDEPETSALLELRSNTMGLLLPRMTTAQREAISTPAEGLHVYDMDLNKTYYFNGGTWEPVEGTGGGGGSSPWQDGANGIYYSAGNVGVGTTAGSSVKLTIDQQDETFGLNLYSFSSTSDVQTGIYSFLSENGSGSKTGVLGQVYANTFSASDVYGVRGEAHQSTSNAHVYGIYGSATGTGNGLRWAGYFDGDVRVATQMRIGGGNFLPHESAILDLTSTDKALLLPRMTAAQREAISPLTYGLVVYDTDSLEAYVYGGPGGWNPMGGSSSAPGLWSELNGFGIYYDAGLVGVGGLPLGNTSLSIEADDEDTGLYLYQNSNSSSAKYGIRIEHSGAASGDNYGVYSKITTSSSSTDPSYGIYGEVFQGTSSGPVYGIYGTVTGSGSNERWAGYFDGNVRVDGRSVTNELEITGGSDLAEYFGTKSPDGIAPGTVVVIVTDQPGMVEPSSKVADKRVVGVVSGANGIQPGLLMGQKGSIAFGDLAVAIAGRVYVKTDQSGGKIEPGDFLTTSAVPGSACKVDDWDAARGAILGKALTYADDNGFVLILVNLQ